MIGKIVVAALLMVAPVLAQEDSNLSTVYRWRTGGKFYEYKAELSEVHLIDDADFSAKLSLMMAKSKFDALKSIDPRYRFHSMTFRRASSHSKVWVVVIDSFLKTDDGVNYREMKKDVYLFPDMKKLKGQVVK